MDDNAIMAHFQPLYGDLVPEDAFHIKKPLLAHYTTIQTLEKILASNEVWFSNPLFMNDLDEVRFGVLWGNTLVMQSEEIAAACQAPERTTLFRQSFAHYFGQFDTQHVLDTYVFCMSEHERDDNDGMLSMWRGYGANGNGAAIVFDTANLRVAETSPLIISNVHYARTEERIDWLKKLISQFAQLLRASNIPQEKVHLGAYSLFERIKLFALFSKHGGFKEEREWRVVYMPDRDANKKLEPMLHYAIGPRGIEPKLKYKVLPIEGVTSGDLSLTKLIDRIILGPTNSSPLARMAVQRMFDRLRHPDLKPRLLASTIPFRSIA